VIKSSDEFGGFPILLSLLHQYTNTSQATGDTEHQNVTLNGMKIHHALKSFLLTSLWKLGKLSHKIIAVCDPLRENRPFAKIIQNALEGRKVSNMKTGYLPRKKNVLERNILFLVCVHHDEIW